MKQIMPVVDPAKRDHKIAMNDLGKANVKKINYFKEMGTPTYLRGGTSSGKSVLVRILCKMWGQKSASVAANPQLLPESVVGMPAMINGNIEFLPGPLTLAIRNGWVFDMEEFTRLPGDIQARFFAICDEGFRSYPIPELGVLDEPVHDDFYFIATGNPVEAGYLTHELDRALIDRFAIIDLGNENMIDEPEVLVNLFGGDQSYTERMMNFASDLRGKENGATHITARQLIQASKAIAIGMPPLDAIEHLIAEKFVDSKEVIKTAATLHFTDQL